MVIIEITVFTRQVSQLLSMDKALFSDLIESTRQADEIVKGERAPSREFYIDALQVKKIRQAVGLSQARFARLIHVSKGTLVNWEQGRRSPSGPASALLVALKTTRRTLFGLFNKIVSVNQLLLRLANVGFEPLAQTNSPLRNHS